MAVTENAEHRRMIERIKVVRAQAIEHTVQARRLASERRDLILRLIDDGYSQADVGRELGVSRQAIQKMLALSPPPETTGSGGHGRQSRAIGTARWRGSQGRQR